LIPLGLRVEIHVLVRGCGSTITVGAIVPALRNAGDVKNREVLGRQLRLLRVLGEHRGGLSSQKLAERLQVSRPTVDRDLKALREQVGIAIARKRVTGEVRHVLEGAPLALAATPTERAALQLAYHSLESLSGTSARGALGALSTELADESTAQHVRVRPPHREPIAPTVLASLERAMQTGRRVRVRVRVAKNAGRATTYHLDPLAIRSSGLDPYLDAWAIERGALRTFKIARVEEVVVLTERADEHPDVDLDALFASAVKTWQGDETRVRIRIANEAAWSVREYPLVAGQLVFHEPDGAVIVEADVAGLVEVSRWVLSWGRHAEVLEPAALRERVREELSVALGRYREDDEVRSRKVSGGDGEVRAGRGGGRAGSTRTTQVRGEG
jgi:proteasome accessory factor B